MFLFVGQEVIMAISGTAVTQNNNNNNNNNWSGDYRHDMCTAH
jgi:hypothetical protein